MFFLFLTPPPSSSLIISATQSDDKAQRRKDQTSRSDSQQSDATATAEKGESGGAKADEAPKDATSDGADGAPKEEELTEDFLDSMVELTLTETPTQTLFHLPSVCVELSSQEHRVVLERNAAYTKFCESIEGSSDTFASRHAQTFNFALKNKEVMAAPPATRDVGCTANSWDIHDSQEESMDPMFGVDDTVKMGRRRSIGQNVTDIDEKLMKQVEEIVTASLASPGCLLDTDVTLTHSAVGQSGVVAQGSGTMVPGGASGTNNFGGGGSQGGSRASNMGTNRDGNSSRNINDKSANASQSGSNNVSGNFSSSANVSVSGAGEQEGGPNANSNVWPEVQDSRDVVAERRARTILASKTLANSLQHVERALQQNRFHEKHLLYRDFPPTTIGLKIEDMYSGIEDAMPPATSSAIVGATKDEPAGLEKLWSFRCDLTKGRTVSGVCWNDANEDLLAVSYGQFEFSHQKDGLVLFWSLRNPEFPQRVINLPCGATSLAFSSAHPNMLAVGLYNGSVAIFDARKDDEQPVVESGMSGTGGKHLDAVWQVQWVDKGSERGESLVSISTDGRVTEWSLKKGLSFTDLMVLKRVPNQSAGKEQQNEGIISRQASGLCFDFGKGGGESEDSSIYFAGTEDGLIHKCSCSYNEQYLQNYYGHSGPVNKIRISPYWNNAVLSCSADWTIKLWNQKYEEPVHSFHSNDLADVVHDICWSPHSSTVFGSVTADGRIELWDLHVSPLDPVVRYFPEPDEDELVVDKQEESKAENAEDDKSKDADLDSEDRDMDNDITDDKEGSQADSGKDTDQPKKKRLTSILFSRVAPVVVTGDDLGSVDVYRVYGIGQGTESFSRMQNIERLKAAMYPDGENVSHSNVGNQ
jgi:WD40 repeat protein